MRSKKLAIVTTHPIQYYAPVFKALSSQDIQVKVFYTWGADSVKKYDPDFNRTIEWDIPLLEGYEYEFLQNSSTKPGTTHFRGIVNPTAIKTINQFDPDAILVYGWSWQGHLQIIRHYARKKPVWFRGDSTLLDKQSLLKKMIRSILLRWVYRSVDLAFYVGTNNKAYFWQFGLRENQLLFAPHSIDNRRFANHKLLHQNSLRRQFGLPDEAILVLFAGKLEPKKDPYTLLNAFLNLTNENVYLLFVGNGVLEETLKKAAQESNKPNKIFFLDFQNQGKMPEVYQACQLFCLPSIGPGETWGLAVNEAMAAGKAVIVSDRVGSAVDLVKPGANGDIFTAGNVTELNKKLAHLTSNPLRLAKMGEGSGRIIENWSIECQIAPILEEVRKLH